MPETYNDKLRNLKYYHKRLKDYLFDVIKFRYDLEGFDVDQLIHEIARVANSIRKTEPKAILEATEANDPTSDYEEVRPSKMNDLKIDDL